MIVKSMGDLYVWKDYQQGNTTGFQIQSRTLESIAFNCHSSIPASRIQDIISFFHSWIMEAWWGIADCIHGLLWNIMSGKCKATICALFMVFDLWCVFHTSQQQSSDGLHVWTVHTHGKMSNSVLYAQCLGGCRGWPRRLRNVKLLFMNILHKDKIDCIKTDLKGGMLLVGLANGCNLSRDK